MGWGGGGAGKRPGKPAALKGGVLEALCLAPDQGTGDSLLIGSDRTALSLASVLRGRTGRSCWILGSI